jgi:hypothetical protein
MLLALAVVITITPARAAEPPQWLLGTWVLNNDLTVAAQEKVKSGGGRGGGGISTTVAVGGVAVPLPGNEATAPVSGNPQDPHVLRCTELEISMEGENIHMVFGGVGDEVLEPGNNQGRVTRWNSQKLTSNYETTSRKVSRTFELEDDGTLLVTVKIRPKRSASIVQKRVFQRPPA